MSPIRGTSVTLGVRQCPYFCLSEQKYVQVWLQSGLVSVLSRRDHRWALSGVDVPRNHFPLTGEPQGLVGRARLCSFLSWKWYLRLFLIPDTKISSTRGSCSWMFLLGAMEVAFFLDRKTYLTEFIKCHYLLVTQLDPADVRMPRISRIS